MDTTVSTTVVVTVWEIPRVTNRLVTVTMGVTLDIPIATVAEVCSSFLFLHFDYLPYVKD